MAAWDATYANLVEARFSALVAYAHLLVDDRDAARDLAQDALAAVFSQRHAPHNPRAAEWAVRAWMATHAPDPLRAAVALQAIDSLDHDGVFAVLGEATPPLVPELSEGEAELLRARFAEESLEDAAPTGGVDAGIDTVRRRRKSAVVRTSALIAGAAVALLAAGYLGSLYLPTGEAITRGATTSGIPENQVEVTWYPLPDYEAAMGAFEFPKCGEEYAPAVQSVGGVTPQLRTQGWAEAGTNRWVMMAPGFVGAEDGPNVLLTDPHLFVVTRDDVVVYTSRAEYDGMELFYVNSKSTTGSEMGLSRRDLCDASAEALALARELGDSDWDTMTEEEQAAQQAAWEDFDERWQEFEPGVYKVYQVSPMVFGEQAALGQQLALSGVGYLQALEWGLGYSPVGADPRVVPYCTGNRDEGNYTCDVPAKVLAEVLTRRVDSAAVLDIAPGLGISEPLVLDWTEPEG